jgi:hypothetical protein
MEVVDVVDIDRSEVYTPNNTSSLQYSNAVYTPDEQVTTTVLHSSLRSHTILATS